MLAITQHKAEGPINTSQVVSDFTSTVLVKGRSGAVEVPVKVDGEGRLIIATDLNIDVGDITIGAVEQGGRSPEADPWEVKFPEPQEVTLSGHIIAIGDQTVTVGDTAVGLTPPQNATMAVITVEQGADIRFRLRGNVALPTPEVGHIAEGGDDLLLSSRDDILAFRAVRKGSLDAALFVTYSEVV